MSENKIGISKFIKKNGELNSLKFLEELKVIKYLSIFTKQLLIEGAEGIDGIVGRCIVEDDNGYFIVDHFSRQIALDLTLVQYYSNIELDIDDVTVDGEQINIYDYIVENGIVNEVKELMDCREYDFFIDLLEESTQSRLDSENRIEANVVKIRNKIFELVDKANVQLDKFNLKELQKVGKSLIKDLNKNPEVIDRLKDVLLINKEVNGVDWK